MNSIASLAVGIALVAGSTACAAEDFLVSQKDKKFSTAVLKAKVGDSVVFRNDDPYFHNIFSLSPSQPFDLGSYPQGQTRKVSLTKEGEIDVECAIHPEMRMVIDVRK